MSAAHAIPAEVRLYDHLFARPVPGGDSDEGDWKADINLASLERLEGCQVEPSLAAATAESRYQFERTGYFCLDPDSTPGKLVFNRSVTLRDTWAKIEQADRSAS